MREHDDATRPTGRIAARGATALSTGLTVVLAAGLVIGGAGVIGDRAGSAERPAPAPAPVVRVAPIEPVEGYAVARAFVGQVEPRQEIALGFETGGTLAEVLVDEGDRVAAGQIVARLDTRALAAERAARAAARDALAARLELAEITLARQETLERSGVSATQRLDEARLAAAELRARIAEADATLAGIGIALDKAVLRAPFAGEIGRRAADRGQVLAAGTPVFGLFEHERPRLRVGLPPQVAAGLAPGARYSVEIAGQDHAATLEQLRPDLDPATRTRSAVFVLQTDPAAAPPYGQTGRLRLSREVTDPGAWVPLAALGAGPNGSWRVLTVDPDGRTTVTAVELLHAEAGRAFVRGGFAPGARAIAAGAHRVVPGEAVRVAE